MHIRFCSYICLFGCSENLKQNCSRVFQVKVALYKGGKETVSIEFDTKFLGKSSDNINWFSASKMINSPWTDVKYEPKNIFSLKGSCHPLCRNFLINRNYGGCGADAGWLGTTGKHCGWEKKYPYPSILYSKKPTYTNWNRDGKFYTRGLAWPNPTPTNPTLTISLTNPNTKFC